MSAALRAIVTPSRSIASCIAERNGPHTSPGPEHWNATVGFAGMAAGGAAVAGAAGAAGGAGWRAVVSLVGAGGWLIGAAGRRVADAGAGDAAGAGGGGVAAAAGADNVAGRVGGGASA